MDCGIDFAKAESLTLSIQSLATVSLCLLFSSEDTERCATPEVEVAPIRNIVPFAGSPVNECDSFGAAFAPRGFGRLDPTNLEMPIKVPGQPPATDIEHPLRQIPHIDAHQQSSVNTIHQL